MTTERENVVEAMREFDTRLGPLPDDFEWNKDKRFLVSSFLDPKLLFL